MLGRAHRSAKGRRPVTKPSSLPTRSLVAMLAIAFASTSVIAGLPSAAGAATSAPIAPAVAAAMKKNGKAVFWVVLKAKPDLRSASAMGWAARGRFVADKLRSTAEQSQTGLRALLRARGADFTTYWGANVIRVTADSSTLDAVAHRSEVKGIEPDRVYHVSQPAPGIHEAVVQAVEWNISNIRADQVWSTFGDRGEGVVV